MCVRDPFPVPTHAYSQPLTPATFAQRRRAVKANARSSKPTLSRASTVGVCHRKSNCARAGGRCGVCFALVGCMRPLEHIGAICAASAHTARTPLNAHTSSTCAHISTRSPQRDKPLCPLFRNGPPARVSRLPTTTFTTPPASLPPTATAAAGALCPSLTPHTSLCPHAPPLHNRTRLNVRSAGWRGRVIGC